MPEIWELPVRICCGQRHNGPVCPDGLVMCCLCFDRFIPDENTTEDICPICVDNERQKIED